jgi:hypothetical protein
MAVDRLTPMQRNQRHLLFLLVSFVLQQQLGRAFGFAESMHLFSLQARGEVIWDSFPFEAGRLTLLN